MPELKERLSRSRGFEGRFSALYLERDAIRNMADKRMRMQIEKSSKENLSQIT